MAQVDLFEPPTEHPPVLRSPLQRAMWARRWSIRAWYASGLSTSEIARELCRDHVWVGQQSVYCFMRDKLGIRFRTPGEGMTEYRRRHPLRRRGGEHGAQAAD